MRPFLIVDSHRASSFTSVSFYFTVELLGGKSDGRGSVKQVRRGNDRLDAKRGARRAGRRSACRFPPRINEWVSQRGAQADVCTLKGWKGGRGKRMKGVEFVGYEFPRAGPPRRRPGTEACRIRVPCICNEGCAPPTRRWQCRCARCIKAQPMADYRRSRPRASNSFYAPRYLSSPGHWNAIPRADDLYLANARPRGRMSHVPSLCLYRSPSKISRSAEPRYAWHVRTSTIGATIRLRIESERSTLKNLRLQSYTGFLFFEIFSHPPSSSSGGGKI